MLLIFLVHLVITVLRALLTVLSFHALWVPSIHCHIVHQRQHVFRALWDHTVIHLVCLLLLVCVLPDHFVLQGQHQKLEGLVPLAIIVLMELNWRSTVLQECTVQAQETLNHLVTVVQATIVFWQQLLLCPLMESLEENVQQEVIALQEAQLEFLANQVVMVTLKEQGMRVKHVFHAPGVIIVKELDWYLHQECAKLDFIVPQVRW